MFCAMAEVALCSCVKPPINNCIGPPLFYYCAGFLLRKCLFSWFCSICYSVLQYTFLVFFSETFFSIPLCLGNGNRNTEFACCQF
ncbi:hypothetical protein XELAEV_18039355mg [Xenopus laevis]|uniref:Uncharacterized protein n=1 Tax=Xenopus laevis TaxID=8355 RepID=A0A974H7U2_XENLA|nr:hypothetical protein XELAEV_18039355mg [Xenopus laevis]